MKVLSIIIPVYNVEKYVEKCLRSCEDQDLAPDEYEIIVINDGAKDSSLEIVESVSRDYNNIIIYSQNNAGLSSARNKGLEIAKGEYIWFVDSDDWIEKNCLKGLANTLRHNDVDICQISYRLTYDDCKNNVDVSGFSFDGVKTGHEVTIQGGLFSPAPFGIYKTSFLKRNSLKFVTGILHEDSEFKPRVVLLANRIMCYSPVIYDYYQREKGSITSFFSLKRGEDIIKVNNSLYEFSHNYSLDIIIAFNKKISMNLNSLFLGFRELNKIDQKKIVKVLSNNRHQIRAMMCANNIKYFIEGFCFFVNINFGLFIHKKLR